MTRFIWIVGVAVTLLVLAFVVLCVSDNAIRRRYAASRVRAIIANSARGRRCDECVSQLAAIARSRYSFEAIYAAASLRHLKCPSSDVNAAMISLLDNRNRGVAREAAIGLTNVRVEAPEQVRAIADAVASGKPSEDVTLFCIEALGNCGESASEFLPLLKEKLGVGPPVYEDALNRAIAEIEKSQGSRTE